MCRRTLFLSSNVAVANWPTLRLQCHRRKDFWKDLFKRASSESLLLVCLIYFLAWFYSWKIECDVRARWILLLRKVWKRETVRYLKIFMNYLSRKILPRNFLYKDNQKCWSSNSECRFLHFDTAMKNMETEREEMTVKTTQWILEQYLR